MVNKSAVKGYPQCSTKFKFGYILSYHVTVGSGSYIDSLPV